MAAVSLLVINGCNGLFGAFSSRIVAEGLHTTSALSTGRLMTILIASLGVGQLLSTKLDRWLGCRIGLAAVAWGTAVSAAGVNSGSPGMTILGTVVIGLGAGAAFHGSTRLIAEIAPPGGRAECYSAYMVVGFVSMATSALLSGSVLRRADLSSVLFCASGLAALLAAYTFTVRPTTDRRLTKGAT